MLDYVGVVAGDVIMNPPGTIHALGKGILLYEIQQSSDLTYRLYDWDRNDPDRSLHVERSLDVADLEPLTTHKTSPVELQEAGGSRTFLVACRHFAAELLRVQAHMVERPSGACFHLLTVLQGSGRVRYSTSPKSEVRLSSGGSVLVPAGIQEYRVQAEEYPFVAIKAYVPDLLEDVVIPLRQRRVADDTIAQLGGEPRNSDLFRYIRQDA
jgi:mannose-6-phosphate isomerase